MQATAGVAGASAAENAKLLEEVRQLQARNRQLEEAADAPRPLVRMLSVRHCNSTPCLVHRGKALFEVLNQLGKSYAHIQAVGGRALLVLQ